MNKIQKAVKQIEEETANAEQLIENYTAGQVSNEDYKEQLEIYAQIERLAKTTLNIIIVEKKTDYKIGLWV
jgi:hypothetical protein